MSEQYLQPLRETLAMIDSVHYVQPKGQVEVILDAHRRDNAEYRSLHRSPGKPVFIRQSKLASEPHLTFAHELAHFIDNRLLHPLSATFASQYDDSLVPLLEVITQSPELMRVHQILETRFLRLSLKERRHLSYLLESQELFARSYAQFIAVQSNNPTMARQLLDRQQRPLMYFGIPVNLQWDSPSFEPIMDAMASLFRAKGWL